MVQFNRRPHRRHFGAGPWLWHTRTLPPYLPSSSADRLLDRLAQVSHPQQPPAPSPMDAHPLAWLADRYGLDAYIRIVEGR